MRSTPRTVILKDGRNLGNAVASEMPAENDIMQRACGDRLPAVPVRTSGVDDEPRRLTLWRKRTQ